MFKGHFRTLNLDARSKFFFEKASVFFFSGCKKIPLGTISLGSSYPLKVFPFNLI